MNTNLVSHASLSLISCVAKVALLFFLVLPNCIYAATSSITISNLTDGTVWGNTVNFSWSPPPTETVYEWRLRVGTNAVGSEDPCKYLCEAYGFAITAKSLSTANLIQALPQDGSRVDVRLEYIIDPSYTNPPEVITTSFISQSGNEGIGSNSEIPVELIPQPRGNGPGANSGIPGFSLVELKNNAPALPSYSLKRLGEITPELPKNPVIPLVDPSPNSIVNPAICTQNNQLQDPIIAKPGDINNSEVPINWRANTNRKNPIMWMVATASNSDVPQNQKEELWNLVNSRFRHWLAESLPMSSSPDSRIPNNENDLSNFKDDLGSLSEHALLTFLIPYAELLEGAIPNAVPNEAVKLQISLAAAKEAIIGHAKWMASLKTTLHGPQGPAFIIGIDQFNGINHDDTIRRTNFRAWMRLFKNMVLFSESRFVKEVPGLQNKLVVEANKMLNWLLNKQAEGSSNPRSVGWIENMPAYYFEVFNTVSEFGTPQLRDKRHIWLRFLELWHGVLEQVRNTDYYKSNKHNGVMDILIERTKDATNRIVKSSENYKVPTVDDNLVASLTNYRAHAWLIDKTDGPGQCVRRDDLGNCHEVFSYPDDPDQRVTPADFFQNYNMPAFKEHVNYMCAAGDVHHYRYLPATVSTYTRLQLKEGSSCTLDADGNGSADALTDGVLFTRHMIGSLDDALILDAVSSNCTRCDATDIEPFIAQCNTSNATDIDGNGDVDALTDGLLITRNLLGLRGDALITDSVAADCTRCEAVDIEAYLQTLLP